MPESERERGISWSDPVEKLPGIGPSSGKTLSERGITCVGDLVWTLPIAFDDLRAPRSVAEVLQDPAGGADLGRADAGGARVCVRGIVKSATVVPMRGRRAVRVIVADPPSGAADSGGAAKKKEPTISAWWFFMAHAVLSAAKPGEPCLLVGRLNVEKRLMAHPDFMLDGPDGRIVRARYPRLGIAEATVRKAIAAALDSPRGVSDPVPARIASREKMPPLLAAMRAVHGRGGVLAEPPADAARACLGERLGWAEAFTHVWARLGAGVAGEGASRARALPRNEPALARLRAELGFALTASQERAIREIGADLAQTAPMRRLLLGDVGTGKTAVLLAAAAQCVAAGAQVAILAPTGVLAEQYLDAARPLMRQAGGELGLVTGADRSAVRRRTLGRIARGDIKVVVGTHALLSQDVQFADLALVIVDEQHRLGVAQRLSLASKGLAGKGTRPHLLTVSATPIPRTLALALRGELPTSRLDERPMGRPPVVTRTWPRARMAKVIERLGALCARGERAFFVSPRIDVDPDDPNDDPSNAAIVRAEELGRALGPHIVTLVHGSMRPEEKAAAMRAFRRGEAQVLVGTTVIEVGIDVPEATLIIVDGAERFGLAQLHQMRGRVGRGARPGTCLLVHDEPLSPLAQQRLDALCRLSDGAQVAQADLELRGAGELGGTRQSGSGEELHYLDPLRPPPWIERIEADARALHASDPLLEQHPDLQRAVRRADVAIAVREEAG
ncbi:ATP-dependent DNA helicase RecG [Pendulispora albinea]|uniref:ATP-dependent DNA helicase RecG n=1 Tax=Pendulispora albinea TaxID=2741071 RepID=A0ABZ2MAE8_9BACT